jgi:S1-C subfamily serine protease
MPRGNNRAPGPGPGTTARADPAPRRGGSPGTRCRTTRRTAACFRMAAALSLACVSIAACGDDTDAPFAGAVDVGLDIGQVARASAVDVRATGCRTEDVRGAGAVIDGGFVLTAAHVVSGAGTITVRGTASSAAVDATVVAFDPVNDLALLSTASAVGAPLPVAAAPMTGDGVVVLFRHGQAVVTSVTIAKPVIVHILDIFHEDEIDRPGYIATIDIDPGDSGAVLVTADGHAAGVLYAVSRADPERSFATDTSAFDALVAEAVDGRNERPADSTRCI